MSNEIANAANHVLRTTGTPGVTIAIVADGELLLQDGFGFADLNHRVALPADAQFYIYSVTKSLIAIATLQLVEQHHLVLDEPVQTYLPGLRLHTTVTLRHLLANTGGIADYAALPAYVEAVKAHPQQAWTSQEFLAHTLPLGLQFAPGHGWGYSNIGFLLLRLVIEQVTGMSLHRIFAQQLFAPLGLRQTFVAQSVGDGSVLTPGYSTLLSDTGELQNIATRYDPGWVSHGVVISTSYEVATIFEALVTGKLLSAASLAAMRTPTVVSTRHPFFVTAAYGLGVMIDPHSPYGDVLGHGGEGPGYSAVALEFAHVNGRRIICVVLANREQHDLSMGIAFAAVKALEDRWGV